MMYFFQTSISNSTKSDVTAVPGPPHSENGRTPCVLPKCPFCNKRKRSTRIDFTHRTFAVKGGGGGGGGVLLKKACITKEKGRPVLTLHTRLLLKRGGRLEHAYAYLK